MRAVVVRAALAATSVGLLVATLVQREWIELVFRVDPDGGNGSLEWVVVVLTAVAAVAFGTLTAREWHRLRTVASTA